MYGLLASYMAGIWQVRNCLWSIKCESEVTQSCPTLCEPVDYSLPGSSVHGVFQARIREWVAISFSRRSSQLRNWIWVSHIVGRCFTIGATREVKMNRHSRGGHFQDWELSRGSYKAGVRNGNACGTVGERLSSILEWIAILVAMDHEEQNKEVG